jgi:hypothetical protein
LATVGYPKGGKPVSQATISKLKSAMGDPTKTFYGQSLGGRVPPSALGSDRFLPENFVMSPDSITGDGTWQPNMVNPDYAPYTLWEVMKDKTHVDSDRSKAIKVTSFGLNVLKALKDLQQSNGNNPKARKVIDDAYHQLITAPQIKAQEEELARQKKAQEEELARQKKAKELEYATLKMRVIELEKKQTPTSTAPAITTSPTSYLPIAVVGIVIVVILLFLRRRA